MAGWSDLPKDLVLLVAARFLNDNDLDYYMNFRAVCGHWRRSTPDPKKDCKDPKLQPKSWAVLKHYGYKICDVTMVNLRTSRIVGKNIPQLGDYDDLFLTIDGGLLVVGEGTPDGGCRAWVLNPFTCSSARFTVPIPTEEIGAVAVSASPMRIFVSDLYSNFVGWVDPKTQEFEKHWAEYPHYPVRMTELGGDVYVAGQYGSIFSSADDEGITPGDSNKMVKMTQTIGAAGTWEERNCDYYLVESGGELLRVAIRPGNADHLIDVHKVDRAGKILEPVTTIGRRAIFISEVRSFSIEPFPTIKSGCIYFKDPTLDLYSTANRRIIATTFHLENQKKEDIIESGRRGLRSGPPTMFEVLAGYCEFTIPVPAYEYPFFCYEEDLDDFEGDEEACIHLI